LREWPLAGERYLDRSTRDVRRLDFESGERFYEVPLVDGLREGVGRSWRRDGTLRVEETFVRGERDGPATYYDESGRRVSEGDYRADLRVGVWREWYSNGQRRSEGTYKEIIGESGAGSARDGVWCCWRPDGSVDPSSSGVYVAGELQSR
jgi:hypothetical protein